MDVGAILPQMELPVDVGALLAWVQAAEDLGYRHIVVFDHVLGADRLAHAPWSGSYDVTTTFHEAFVVLGFLAGRTNLGLATGILVLPQREVSLVAKQAAEVDLISEGRLRLGIGVGWNEAEMRSLGYDFATRGRRMDEQIDLLRRLWCDQVVTYAGQFHHLDAVGIAPRPARPIPIWIGGSSPAALRRVGRSGDGWFAPPVDFAALRAGHAQILAAAREAGRDGTAIGVEGRLLPEPGAADSVAAKAEEFSQLGASHLSVATHRRGLHTVDEHVALLDATAGVLGLTATQKAQPCEPHAGNR